MTRPRGEIRTALYTSASSLAGASPLGGTTWRAAAEHAMGCGVALGYEAARCTWDNMLRAGELQLVGTVRVEHANRPMRLCAPVVAPPSQASGSAGEALGQAISSWAQFR